MSIKVDYILVHSPDFEVVPRLGDVLLGLYEDVYDDTRVPEIVEKDIDIKYSKILDEDRVLTGFNIEFEFDESRVVGGNIKKEIAEAMVLITGFNRAVSVIRGEGIFHLIKFNDESLKLNNQILAEEIFEIEMKLREALTIVLLSACPDEVLRLPENTRVKCRGTDLPTEAHLYRHCETDLFYLYFGDYANLDEPNSPTPQSIARRLLLVKDFASLQREFLNPIENENDLEFISSLKRRSKPIEDIRNYVAHNKSIPVDLNGGYEMAKTLLVQTIEAYFNKLSDKET